MAGKLDTRSIGLDVGLSFAHWLTGAENLHYGDWTGLPVCAANVGPAQVAYTKRLFGFLPPPPARILDIGGGAGETARKLLALGYEVEIVIPSAFLAGRCRENAPGATVHEMVFQEFSAPDASFDICLFSESFQYIPMADSLPKCLALLAPGGRIVIADCFRSEAFEGQPIKSVVGGGHAIARFRDTLASLDLTVEREEDITTAVAPSVDVEQGLFNVVGHGLTRVDRELEAKKPRMRWLLHRLLRLFANDRKRARLHQRLMEQTRNAQAFAQNNTYLMLRLAPPETTG